MKCGRKTCFHGAYAEKKDAVRKERSLGKTAFIQRSHIHGEVRWLVRTQKPRKSR